MEEDSSSSYSMALDPKTDYKLLLSMKMQEAHAAKRRFDRDAEYAAIQEALEIAEARLKHVRGRDERVAQHGENIKKRLGEVQRGAPLNNTASK